MSFALVEPVIQKATDELDQVAQKGCAVYDFAASLWEEGSLHLADLTLSEARELYLRNFLRKYIQSVKHNIKERSSTLFPYYQPLPFLILEKFVNEAAWIS